MLNLLSNRGRLMNFLAIMGFCALLAALLWPAMTTSDRPSSRTQCKNSLKQIGLALHNVHDAQHSFPARHSGEPAQSWRLALLPWLDETELYRSYRPDRAWDAAENAEFARRKVGVYQCPSQKKHTDATKRWLTSYAVVYGPHCLWQDEGAPTLSQITDGAANTIVIVEACRQNIVWNEPRDIDGTQTPFTITSSGQKSPLGICSSHHLGGVNVLLADGTVRFLSQRIDPRTLAALLTVDGGETLGDW